MVLAPDLVIKLLRTLDGLSIPYAIGGSFASSAWGQPRQTRDLDVAVVVNLLQVKRLAEEVRGEFLLSEKDMEEAAIGTAEFRSFQLLHMDDVFKIDVFALDASPYTQEVLRRRRRFSLGTDYEAQFVSPEDIVITKLRWYLLANRISDRQWNDIVHVLETQGHAFDYSYAEKWSAHFGVLDDLQKAKAQIVIS